jgi:hypothetical protein
MKVVLISSFGVLSEETFEYSLLKMRKQKKLLSMMTSRIIAGPNELVLVLSGDGSWQYFKQLVLAVLGSSYQITTFREMGGNGEG